MNELVKWLREQVEARKATAIAALDGSDGHWWRRADDETGDPVGPLWDGEPLLDSDGDVVGGRHRVVYDEGRPSDAQFDHIAVNDPRDTIARCDAELAILDMHLSNGFEKYPECAHCAVEAFPCRTVRLLASAYRHRPGYREEWKP